MVGATSRCGDHGASDISELVSLCGVDGLDMWSACRVYPIVFVVTLCNRWKKKSGGDAR
jgi:hypothetical protein